MSTLTFTEQLTPSTPAAGKQVVYLKTDGILYKKNAAGVESPLVDTAPPTFYPRKYLQDLNCSNDVTDPTNDIVVGIGECVDSTNTYLLALVGAMTKRLDAVWAAGSGNGGRDTGAIADGTWHMFIIRKDSDLSIDVLFSQSLAAPTMPAGYTYKRRIHSIVRVAGVIYPFTMLGDDVIWNTPSYDLNVASISTANRIAYPLRVPLGIKVIAKVQGYITTAGGGGSMVISCMDALDIAASATNVTASAWATGVYASVGIDLRTDTSGQIGLRANVASIAIAASTMGYSDNRKQ